jgi:hypothetical protein
MEDDVQQNPDLLERYLAYCRFKKLLNESGALDLTSFNSMSPTTLVPLGYLMTTIDINKFKLPDDLEVKRHLDKIIGSSTDDSLRVLKTSKMNNTHIETVFNFIREEPSISPDAIKYVLGELMENIDSHSECSNSIAMVQRTQNYIEACIFDNGISIPVAFKQCGFYEINRDIEAIKMAINGKTTTFKGDRGFGLRTSLSMLSKGLHGDVLIVSGAGSVFIERDKSLVREYILDGAMELKGTLVSMRMPLPMPKINYQEYIE